MVGIADGELDGFEEGTGEELGVGVVGEHVLPFLPFLPFLPLPLPLPLSLPLPLRQE